MAVQVGMMRPELITIYERENPENSIYLPVTPAECVFKEEGDQETIKLLNFGEIPVGNLPKLATWTITGIFPKANNNYWFDISEGTHDPYNYYCKTFFDWYRKQTILVFGKETWNGYYNCTIKNFQYGEKDGSGNVHYTLDFCQWKEISYTVLRDDKFGYTDYSADTYFAAEGDTILTIALKIYGSTRYYPTIMRLNNMKNPEIIPGHGYKVR